MSPSELSLFIPELRTFSDEVVDAIYNLANIKYPDDENKLLRYYYFGFLLTSGEESEATEVKISNVSIKDVSGKNYYYEKYKTLLESLSTETVGTDNSVSISIY